MKKYKKIMKEFSWLEKTLCDKCGIKIKNPVDYEVFDFTFELRTGNQYPEGGDGDKYTLDLCLNCTEELMRDLKHNGYCIQESTWDN